MRLVVVMAVLEGLGERSFHVLHLSVQLGSLFHDMLLLFLVLMVFVVNVFDGVFVLVFVFLRLLLLDFASGSWVILDERLLL